MSAPRPRCASVISPRTPARSPEAAAGRPSRCRAHEARVQSAPCSDLPSSRRRSAPRPRPPRRPQARPRRRPSPRSRPPSAAPPLAQSPPSSAPTASPSAGARSAACARSPPSGVPPTATPPRSRPSAASSSRRGAPRSTPSSPASRPPSRRSTGTCSRCTATCRASPRSTTVPMIPLDGLLAAHDPSAHLVDDLFGGKVAFAVLLNFPLTTLEERLRDGDRWTRREWAEARLANRFARRVPAEVNQAIAKAGADADLYVAGLQPLRPPRRSPAGERLFPKGKRLLSPLEPARRAEGAVRGGGRARAPAGAREGDGAHRQPDDPGRRRERSGRGLEPGHQRRDPRPRGDDRGRPRPRAPRSPPRASPTRATRASSRTSAPRAPRTPTRPRRPRCWRASSTSTVRSPSARAVALLEAVLGAPEIPRVARRVSTRLGRPLEPFDVWYAGFRPRSDHTEAELDRDAREPLPGRGRLREGPAGHAARARLLAGEGPLLAERIAVDPARGSGHAHGGGAARRPRPPAHAHRAGRDGLQGLQHRRPRARPQRRADVLAVRRGLDAARAASRTPPSPRRSPSSSRRATSRCWACRRPHAEARRLLALDRLWDTLRDRRRRARGPRGLALDVRPSRARPPRELREATRGIAAPRLESLVRAGARRPRRSPARDLLAHGRTDSTCRTTPLATSSAAQLEDHLAAAEGHAPRRGDRAHHGAASSRRTSG